MIRVVLLAVVTAGLLLPSIASALVVEGDVRIGSFAVKRDMSSLGGAIEAFGEPSSLRSKPSVGCIVGWRDLGLSIEFYNIRGEDPCQPQHGRFSRAIIRGKQWRTSKGLRIGDPARLLHAIYPRAQFHKHLFIGSGWWIVTRRSIDGPYPGLMARLRDGRVYDFVVRWASAGE